MGINLLKLVSGEEIVTEVVNYDGRDYEIKEPIVLYMTQEGVGVVPFMPFAETREMLIPSEHVMIYTHPNEDVENMYRQRFGSGIQVVSNSQLLKG